MTKGYVMMKKAVLALTVGSVFFMSGCSSYPETDEGVAEAVCSAFKKGDLNAAKTYMSADALAKTEANEGVIKKFFALPEFKQKTKGLDCRKSNKHENLAKDHERFYFGEFNVEIKKIDGKWKLLS
jgi:hypothetical protein